MSKVMTGRPHATAWVLLVLALPALYVLSVAPVKSLYRSGMIPASQGEWLSRFYAPAEWVIHGTALRKPMHAYEKWWRKVIERW